jgi:protein O-mannosyl-transferase
MKILEQLNLKWILLIAAVVHIPMLRNDFTYYSDDVYVLNNFLVHHINKNTVNALFTTYFDGHYHPLTLLSFAVTYFFSGTNALGYQLTNMLFHLINCFLIYKILTQLDLKKNVVQLSTLIFAIHPLNVESVARITERKDTQYVLFLLLAVYYFILFCKDNSLRKYYLISLGCFILALLSKGQAVVFPLVLYVISWYRFKTSGEKVNHKLIAPLFIFSVWFAYLNYRAQLVTGYLSETEAITIQQFISYPSNIITSYILKLFFPFRLSAQYPIPPVDALHMLYGLFILIMAAGIYLLFRSERYLALLGALLYVATVFPMLRIIPVSENFMPDRYNYLGLMGFGIFFSAMCFELIDKYKKYNLGAFVMGWLVIISLLCFQRTTVWKSGYKIWKDAYAKSPDNITTATNYGTYMISVNKEVEEGLSIFRSGLSKAPADMISRVNYVNLLNSVGRKKESLEMVDEIRKAKPVTSSNMSNRAVLLLQYGEPDKSLPEFNRSILLKPFFAKNRINRAGFYFNQFEFDKALADLDTLETLHSNYIDVIYFMRTDIYVCKSEPAMAQKSLDLLRGLKADPKRIAMYQQKINELNMIISQERKNMDLSQKEKHAALLYSKGLYYQSYVVASGALKEDPLNEKLLNNSMACAYSLARPELVKEYVARLKKNNYKVNENVLVYLSGLGISV